MFFFLEPKGYGSNFSISVPSNITVEAGLSVEVPCTFTYPPSTITEPYERVWFKGDPSNPLFEIKVNRLTNMLLTFLKPSERECSFILKDARKGRTDGEYGFMLKWGNNQHVFSETVHITVTGEWRQTKCNTYCKYQIVIKVTVGYGYCSCSCNEYIVPHSYLIHSSYFSLLKVFYMACVIF